jgi:signal transduction histidine kinase
MGAQERLEAGTPPGGGTGAITALVDAMRPVDEAGAALLHAASHAMRTPLTSIVGFAEVLAEGGAGSINAEQERLLQIITRNASDLLHMVESLDPGATGTRAREAGAGSGARQGSPKDRGFRG